MKNFLLAVWEVAEVVIVAVVTVFIIRSFLVQPFLVSGASMEPNFSSGDYLLIDEISYRFREPARGEVVVFRYPENPSVYYIKRIVGLPGEHVVIRGGNITIFNSANPNGFVYNEPYLSQGLRTVGNVDVVLSGQQLFVLGDNRNYSYDSRSWGPLPLNDMIGLVRLRLLPITKVEAFSY